MIIDASPDADLPPVHISEQDVELARRDSPKMPAHYREHWKRLKLDSTVILALISSRPTAELIDRLMEQYGDADARRVALWFAMTAKEHLDGEQTSEVYGTISDGLPTELSGMVENQELSSTAAKEIFHEMLVTHRPPT